MLAYQAGYILFCGKFHGKTSDARCWTVTGRAHRIASHSHVHHRPMGRSSLNASWEQWAWEVGCYTPKISKNALEKWGKWWTMGSLWDFGATLSDKACRFCCPLYNGVWKGWINHASLQKSNPNPLCNDCNGCSSVMFDIDFAPNLCYQKVMWEEVPPLFYDSPASLWYCSTGKVDPTVVNLPAISHCASQEISWTPPRPRHF